MSDPGRDAYRGFEYQIHVAVWLALLFVGQRGAREIRIEPLGGEDLEILKAPANGADTSDRAVRFSGADYLVQVKGRGSGAWSGEELNEMLIGKKRIGNGKPDASRVWPLSTLRSEPQKLFLFVTDATVEQPLARLVVSHPAFDARPVPGPGLPKALAAGADDLRARVGILQKAPLDVVDWKANLLLTEVFHVPHSQREPCLARLVARVRTALLDAGKSQIDRLELEAIVGTSGGVSGGSATFVEPSDFPRIRRHLDESHALLLLGEPGVGKSTAADHLMSQHRMRAEPFEIVEPPAPRQLRKIAPGAGPILVFVEDPFGKFAPVAEAHEWLLELEEFCQRVQADLRLLVTSRTSFSEPLLSTTRTVRLSRHSYTLRPSGYEPDLLLTARVEAEPGLDRDARKWIDKHRAAILKTLVRPISFSALAGSVAATKPADRDSAAMKQIIDRSASADLGLELEETFSACPDPMLRGMVAVWLALEVWPRRSDAFDDQLRRLADDLLESGIEVDAVTTRLESHRWLRRRTRGAPMHPAYVEACLKVVRKRPALASEVAGLALAALWAREVPAVVLSAWRALKRAGVKVSQPAQQVVFSAARLRLVAIARHPDARSDFVDLLELVGARPDTGDPVTMVAAALVFERSSRRLGQLDWSRPSWSQELLDAVRADVDAVTVARTFVRESFPTFPHHGLFSEEAVVDFLYKIADMSGEFDALLIDIDGAPSAVNLVAAGAARSRNADHAALLERAKAIYGDAQLWESRLEAYDQDSDRGDWLADDWSSRVEAADALIDAVLGEWNRLGTLGLVASRAEPEVFERLIQRFPKRSKTLVDPFIEIFKACPDDLKGKLAAQAMSHRELFPVVLRLLPDIPRWQFAKVTEELIDADHDATEVGEVTAAVRSAVEGALTGLPAFERVAVVHELSRRQSTNQLGTALCNDLAKFERSAVAALDADLQEAGPETMALLRNIQQTRFDSSTAALSALARLGEVSIELVAGWLSSQATGAQALAAVDVCTHLSPADAIPLLHRALQHPRSTVKRRALEQLASILDEASTAAILSVVADETGSVRAQVATSLAGRRDAASVAALLSLLKDATDTSETARSAYRAGIDDQPHHPEYGVAQAAASALAELPIWADELRSDVAAFLASNVPVARHAAIRQALERGMAVVSIAMPHSE